MTDPQTIGVLTEDQSRRFQVVEGSQTHHCCFSATVIDMTVPVMIGGEHYNNQYQEVCECFDEADAEKIAAALNTADRATALVNELERVREEFKSYQRRYPYAEDMGR